MEESVEWEQKQERARWARGTTSLQQLPSNHNHSNHNHRHVSQPQTRNYQFHNPPQDSVPDTEGTFLVIFPGYHTPIIPRGQTPVVYSLMYAISNTLSTPSELNPKTLSRPLRAFRALPSPSLTPLSIWLRATIPSPP